MLITLGKSATKEIRVLPVILVAIVVTILVVVVTVSVGLTSLKMFMVERSYPLEDDVLLARDI